MASTPPRTLVIMPAWNEEAAIAGTIEELRATVPGFDLLVVDDGSRDATAARARAAGALVLVLPYNLGVGGAMRAGYKYAQRFGYDRAIQVDADGQHDPRDIERVLAGLEHANISIGARFAEAGAYRVRGPRRWAMVMVAAIVGRISGTRLTDVTSGFRAADRRAIDQYCLHYPAEYLGDTIDSLVIAVRSGLRVRQVGVSMRARQAGTPSNNPVKAAVYLVRSMFALLVSLTRRPASRRQAADPVPPTTDEG
ncbi:glycosyltransferase family 2 protein [Actinomyces slackii]|uniref:Putative glucosyl-3-phosphoglycerate synthase n=1 Tax=Actinomyces slackii TaxID=52774 RepID=A0A3S4U3U7_9ACTO|nr:glycosyltransferase family 2 protein [Actinomyces slackii]VEG75852.1 putative glucosyl-3-phosphoglycerate synthase [Actinomyces slackii]